ncbi:uncharacterized protein DNG_10298 [Cephalotrichum gorgonifer]|uniref:Uncharacterized protein n=1 Tax=Cephalotrichum gorgonifer TaxID=2041049 RepID=A0AAE8T073_9PEZI|nr:uncharacterized protein DNG_10298 [Cephalotrichum gorgonifer]
MSQSQPQQSQAQAQAHPILINLPPPSPTADTPDMPGTPTSTTTSLSALSTTAIKDGHRGHLPAQPHHHTTLHSLEAERADRISRLAGLERVSSARNNPSAITSSPGGYGGYNNNYTHYGAPAPAYFDAQGQPAAYTKMSTSGTASATSPSGDGHGEGYEDDGEATTVDYEDAMSLNRDVGSVASHGDAMSHEGEGEGEGEGEAEGSDGDAASLVGFGEGAGSTISGPIYRRGQGQGLGGVERSSSGLSEVGSETPVSSAAVQERRAARMMNGVVVDAPAGAGASAEEGFVDTTTREPVSVSPRRERARKT